MTTQQMTVKKLCCVAFAIVATLSSAHAETYAWTGAANNNFTDTNNWVGGNWAQWRDYTFGGTPDRATMTINDYNGIGSITLQSGLTTDIVIDSTPNPVIMGTDQSSSLALITIAAASSNLTINGSYTASTAVTWDVGAGRTLTLNGPLNNWYASAALVKKGEGTAVLNGASSYSGGTTVTEGTLKLQGGAFSTTARAYSIASNAVLNLDGNTGVASGTTTLSGNGTLRISGGGLSSGADGRDLALALGGGGLIEIQAGASMINGGWQNMTWTSNLAGMQVDGMLDLNDGNTVIIDALTGTGTVTKDYWNPDGTDTRTLTVGQNNGSGTFSGVITQAKAIHIAALTKEGSGTQILTGANNYSGATTINGGTLQIGDGGSIGTLGSGAVTIAGGATLRINRSDTYGTTYNQNFSGAGTLVKEGAGDLIFNGSSDHTAAQGIENLVISNGLVRTDYYGQWKSDLNLSVNGSGKFELWSTSTSLGTLNGNGTVQNTKYWSRATTLTVAAGSFSGTITDSGITSGGSGTGDTRLSLVKSGAGTLTLSGANSYNLLTDITEGTLVAANNAALGASGWTDYNMTWLRDGATLALQGGVSLGEHMHVFGAGVGGFGAIRSISGTNALTMTYNNSGSGPGYSIDSNTTIGVDADSLTVTGFYESNGSFVLNKVGAGTLIFSSGSTYTGGTIINEGTVIACAGGVALGAVTVASGATLATTSASSTGLAALYYNNAAIDQAAIASLPSLLAHFGANSPAPALVQTAPSMNFGGDGSGFPAPYNSGALNFESFYSGKINIGTAGTYTFNTSSDDGSMIFIDGQGVVTNNVFQPVTTRSGSIALAAGMHDLVIAFNQGGGGYGMNAQMSGPDNTDMVDINTGNASITPDLVVGSLAGAGSVTLTTGNLIMGIDNSSTTFTGALSGIGSVTKFGTGSQTLAGANTYSGATWISAGTLRIDGDSSGVPGALTVASGAFLGGHGSYGGSITLNDGAALNCALNLTDSTLVCGGQLSFANLDFAKCTFSFAPGAGSPPYRRFTLIEAVSLGTTTFANAAGTINGEPAKLYLSGNTLVLSVGHAPTILSFL